MLQRIVGKFLIPSQMISKKYKLENANDKQKLLKLFNATEVSIQAQDKIKLNGVLYKKPFSLRDFFCSRKIIVHFGGNGECHENFDPQYIKKAHKLGCDVLSFNYRGVGESEGRPTPKGLVYDGTAAINYAINCGYKTSNVYVHGHSLGGAIAIKSAESFSEKEGIHLIADRPFSSLKAVINSHKIFWLFKKIICFLITITGWNLNVVEDWKKIKGRKVLIVDSDDEVIPLGGSLYKAVYNETSKEQIFATFGFGHNGSIFTSHMKEIIQRSH